MHLSVHACLGVFLTDENLNRIVMQPFPATMRALQSVEPVVSLNLYVHCLPLLALKRSAPKPGGLRLSSGSYSRVMGVG